MRLLITGGAGCLGSNLIEEFLPKGHEILVIDNFETGNREIVTNIDGVTLIDDTIVNKDVVRMAFNSFKPTHVIHSAASYKDPLNWFHDAETNVCGTTNIVKACDDFGVRRLIFFQTALCYGRPETVPIPITHRLAPVTSYSITKTAAESIVAMGKTPWVSLRLGNVTGPRLAIGPIPTFYSRLRASKDCFCSDTVRDFIDMDDFIDVLRIVLENDAPIGKFNISSGIGHSIKEIFDLVCKYLKLIPKDPEIRPCTDDDIPAVVLDPTMTENLLGWKARVSFEETIHKMLKWYDFHGISAIYSHLKSR